MTKTEFEDAVSRNSQRLFLIALSYTGNREDAEDIMQNTLLKLWRSGKSFADNEHTDKWLTRVCVNECKDIFRSLFRSKTVPLEVAYDVAVGDPHFNIDLFEAVMSLPAKERLIVHLFYYEDMSVGQISSILGIKEPTVRSLLCRSRSKLKNQLGDEWKNE